MIKLTGIEKIYQTQKMETLALSNINLKVDKGQFISVMGPSGSGKSTLLNIIGLLDAPTRGRIVLEGAEIETYKDRHVAKLRNEMVGFIFQTFHLISDLSALDNVEIPLIYRRISGSKRRKKALEARAAATGGDCPGDCRFTQNLAGRRTHRQPGQPHGRRNHGYTEGLERSGKDNCRHGHP
jgi:ABC-type lipoprotein export system ATPase subunit